MNVFRRTICDIYDDSYAIRDEADAIYYEDGCIDVFHGCICAYTAIRVDPYDDDNVTCCLKI